MNNASAADRLHAWSFCIAMPFVLRFVFCIAMPFDLAILPVIGVSFTITPIFYFDINVTMLKLYQSKPMMRKYFNTFYSSVGHQIDMNMQVQPLHTIIMIYRPMYIGLPIINSTD